MFSSISGLEVFFIISLLITILLMNLQVRDFIFFHAGEPLKNSRIIIINALFFIFLLKSVWLYYFIHQNSFFLLKVYFIFSWGLLFCLLDISNHWLPWRFTQSFWIAGVLFSSITGGIDNVFYVLSSSLIVFILLWSIRAIAKRIAGNDGLGLGDVLLISGLFSWFPWQVAACVSAGGFLLVALYSLVTRCSRQPYAPGVFVVLGIYIALFPEKMDYLL